MVLASLSAERLLADILQPEAELLRKYPFVAGTRHGASTLLGAS
jgi:hypothetical protein